MTDPTAPQMTLPNDKVTQALMCAGLTQALHRFFLALDEFRYDEMLATFTPDGVWLRQGQRLVGRDAIAAALRARPAGQKICHVMSNAHLAVRPDSQAVDDATGRIRLEAYMTAYRHESPVPGEVPVVTGPFRLNRVSTWFVYSDGRWLIAEQHMVPEFVIEAQGKESRT